MRVPESLVPLLDYGVLDDVVRPLMSGKEAHVYLVVSGGRYAVAKIYKDAQNRSFKHRAEYTEGRKVRNSRDQRAMANRSKHGREKDEAAWRSTEVDMIHRLHAAGVRVPVPYHFIEGVLLMELVTDADGSPAPRLGDLPFDAASADAWTGQLNRAWLEFIAVGAGPALAYDAPKAHANYVKAGVARHPKKVSTTGVALSSELVAERIKAGGGKLTKALRFELRQEFSTSDSVLFRLRRQAKT